MRMPKPNFSVRVDVANPGQFFACCGLLELAHRMAAPSEVESWFDGSNFCVATPVMNAFQRMRDAVDGTDVTPVKARGEDATHPLRLRDLGITLDWWIDEHGKKTAFKLWAGQQTSEKIFRDLKRAFCDLQCDSVESIFAVAQPMTGRLGVDPRAAWNALDVGFSPNTQKMEVTTFPFVEFMAGVGLQGFRPVQDNQVFRYATWSIPLPAPVARAAAMGALPAGEVLQYSFQILDRGSYGGFDYATPIANRR